MTSLADFLHAFRGFVVALVVLIAGASVTGPGAEAVSLTEGVTRSALGSLAAGPVLARADLRPLSTGFSAGYGGASRSSHSTAGAWRESSRRAPVEVEVAKVESDAEHDDLQNDAPPRSVVALLLVHECPLVGGATRPALPLVAASALSSRFLDPNPLRGPPA